MAALRDIARDFAAEIRDGIGWTIVYRTGRSWNALTIWSDIWNGEWETDDLNDAIGILKADPDAIIVNGYWAAIVASLSAATSYLLSAFGRDPVSEVTGTIFTACVGYLITYAGKSLGEKISRNRHRLDADGNPLPDPSGDTINNEEAQG